MPIARVQFAKGGNSFGSAHGTEFTPNFGSSCTAGNLIVVGVRAENVNDVSTVTDTLGTTYTRRQASMTSDPFLYLYSGVLASSGTNAVTATFTANVNYTWIGAVEYSGTDTTTPYDTGNVGTGTNTDMTAGAISTAQALELLVLFASQNNLTGACTAGTDFTLIDGSMNSGGNVFGGCEEYITSGVLTGYVAHMTSPSNIGFTTVVAAFKASGGAPPSVTYPQLERGIRGLARGVAGGIARSFVRRDRIFVPAYAVLGDLQAAA